MRIAVDESMIRYKGHAISFKQFMPAKPIKHGIKVFSNCCAKTGYLFAFEIFTGAKEGGVVGIVDRLFRNSDAHLRRRARIPPKRPP
jgi:hypothetical protein